MSHPVLKETNAALGVGSRALELREQLVEALRARTNRSDGWDRRMGLDEPHLTATVAGFRASRKAIEMKRCRACR